MPLPEAGTNVGRTAIEVGATDDELRLWLAKEAVRHGELRLTAQQNNLAAMESRATSMFGWSIPTILALGTAALRSRYSGPALSAATCMVGTAVMCAVALWPQPWGHAGHRPPMLLNEQLQSELEVIESIALGYDQTADSNEARLTRFGEWLRVAWLLFLLSPLMGGFFLVLAIWF
jgi:hypothetical protein